MRVELRFYGRQPQPYWEAPESLGKALTGFLSSGRSTRAPQTAFPYGGSIAWVALASPSGRSAPRAAWGRAWPGWYEGKEGCLPLGDAVKGEDLTFW